MSLFAYLREILRSIRDLPIFALFLSTTQLAHPKEDLESARLQSGRSKLIPPFVALGWDHLAAPFPDQLSLADVASLPYKARLGRSL